MQILSMTKIIYNDQLISGKQPCFKYNDRGLTLGHGLFETMLVKQKAVPLLHYHWQRLLSSAAFLQIEMPFCEMTLQEMILNLTIENHLETKLASARLMITDGESDRGILPSAKAKPNYVLSVDEYNPNNNNRYALTISKFIRNERSPSASIKSTSYLDNILARREAKQRGFDEALLLNSKDNVAECSIANVFFRFGGEILTPPVSDGAIPGVIREILLNNFANTHNIHEQSIHKNDIHHADEMFVTNALMGIQSIARLDNRSLPSKKFGIAIMQDLNNLF